MAKSKNQIDEELRILGKYILRKPQKAWRTRAQTSFQDIINYSNSLASGTLQGASNLVYVTASADLPGSPGDGIRNLEGDTIYHFAGQVNISSDRVRAGENTILRGFSRFTDGIITSNPNYLVSGSGNLVVDNLLLVNGGGPVLTWSGSSDSKCLDLYNLSILNSAKCAEIYNPKIFRFENCDIQNVDQGFDIYFTQNTSGSIARITENYTINTMNDATDFVGYNFYDGAVAKLRILNNFFELRSDSVAIAYDSGSIDKVSGLGTVNIAGNTFTSTGSVALSGTSVNNPHFRVESNAGLSDTSTVAKAYFVTSSVQTQVVQNEWHSFSGSYVFGQGSSTQRFQIENGSRLVYTGIASVRGLISVQASAKQGSATRNDSEFAVFKNGSIAESSRVNFTTNGDSGVFITTSNILDLQPGDYIEARMRNVEASTNFTIISSNVIIDGYAVGNGDDY